MSRLFIFSGGALVLVVIGLKISRPASSETFSDQKAKPPEAAPLCPWREPERDLKMLFPAATGYKVERRILSGWRLELGGRLGRAPAPDENAFRFYSIYREETPLGTVLTRRIKGEHGAIELVLATDLERRVCGLHFQRLREPAPITCAIENAEWRQAFAGKQADSQWKLGGHSPDVPPEAQASAQAVLEGARSLLILLETADRAQLGRKAEEHH
jgi:hypothetical protein